MSNTFLRETLVQWVADFNRSTGGSVNLAVQGFPGVGNGDIIVSSLGFERAGEHTADLLLFGSLCPLRSSVEKEMWLWQPNVLNVRERIQFQSVKRRIFPFGVASGASCILSTRETRSIAELRGSRFGSNRANVTYALNLSGLDARPCSHAKMPHVLRMKTIDFAAGLSLSEGVSLIDKLSHDGPAERVNAYHLDWFSPLSIELQVSDQVWESFDVETRQAFMQTVRQASMALTAKYFAEEVQLKRQFQSSIPAPIQDLSELIVQQRSQLIRALSNRSVLTGGLFESSRIPIT